MKISKKLLGFITLLLFAVLLVACKPDEEERNKPTFTGVGAVVLELGAEFDPLAGVAATDHDGNDLTDDIEVTKNTVDTDEVGDYEVEYSVTDSEDLTATATRSVKVTEDGTDPGDDKLYANGQFNYRFADSDLRHTFFAAAEGYLLDNVAGGVPLFINSSSSIYAPRVKLPVEQYVPVMGWGTSFGELTADDSTVNFSGGRTGEPGKHTWRGAFSSNPTTFNQWISDDSVSSDAAAYMLDSLYTFVFNDSMDGYEVVPSMADANPTPLNPETLDSGLVISDTWRVPVKEGLKWGFHPETDTTGLETDIDAQTFVDTFRHALEQGWFRARAGGSHFWATSNPVKGAQEFYNFVVANNDKPEAEKATEAELDAEWAKVGITVTDDNEIVFEFTTDLSEWNLKYWLSSNTMSPVHLGLLNREGVSYARTPQEMAFTGPYILKNYEADKALEYVRNDNFHTPELYNYDGYYFVIIERSEIIFAEFEAGHLDSAGVPLTKIEQYKDNPGLRRSPGATTFRMNINGLGTVENQKAQFPSGPGNTWVPEPILSNVNFKRALYWAIDRETLAYDVLKTSDPGVFYFSDAYLVDPSSGLAFRQTEQGLDLADRYSVDTFGYNEDLAISLFETAVNELVADGMLTLGTSANPLVIELDLSIQAGSTSQAQLAEFIKNTIESTFNTVDGLVFDITIDPVTFPGNYYDRTIPGRYDLGTGGISGSTLDAASFLEVFASDNRGGFTLDWGFDTSIADIPVTYTRPDGTEVENEYWSFDAIVSVLNGPVTVANGVEALDTDAINAAIAAIDALPSVEDYDHAEHSTAFLAAYNQHYGLLPRNQAAVTNRDKLNDLLSAYYEGEDAAAVASLQADIDKLLAGDEDAEAVEDIVETYLDLEAELAEQISADALQNLLDLFVVVIKDAIDELPAEITLDDEKAVANAEALIDNLNELGDAEALLTEARLDKVKAARSTIKVTEVVDLIDDLPEDVVLAHRYDIQDTRAAFNGLSEDEQTLVTNVQRLLDLEAAVKPLVDREEAFLWTLTVLGLPDANDIRTAHSVLVVAAVNAYNQLSDEAKLIDEEFRVGEGTQVQTFTIEDQIAVLEDLMDALSDVLPEDLELKLPTTN